MPSLDILYHLGTEFEGLKNPSNLTPKVYITIKNDKKIVVLCNHKKKYFILKYQYIEVSCIGYG